MVIARNKGGREGTGGLRNEGELAEDANLYVCRLEEPMREECYVA